MTVQSFEEENVADAFDVAAYRQRTQNRPGRILVIAGWSGVGKTTLICKVIPELRALGVKVSTIKHAHEGFDLDRREKDSFKHREAGAHEVLIISPRRWALLHELGPEEAEFDVMAGAKKLAPTDLILVEGFKGAGLPTIEVRRTDLNRADMPIPPSSRVAIVTDDLVDGGVCPVISPSDPARLARHIVSWMQRGGCDD